MYCKKMGRLVSISLVLLAGFAPCFGERAGLVWICARIGHCRVRARLMPQLSFCPPRSFRPTTGTKRRFRPLSWPPRSRMGNSGTFITPNSYDDRSIVVVNSVNRDYNKFIAEISLYNFSLRQLFNRNIAVNSAADSVRRLLTIPEDAIDTDVHFVRLS